MGKERNHTVATNYNIQHLLLTSQFRRAESLNTIMIALKVYYSLYLHAAGPNLPLIFVLTELSPHLVPLQQPRPPLLWPADVTS